MTPQAADGPLVRKARWTRTPIYGLLQPSTRAVLDLLSAYADRQGSAFPAISTMARDLNCHRSTVVVALAEAKAARIIAARGRVPRRDRLGAGPVRYEILPPPPSAETLEEVILALKAHQAARRAAKQAIRRPGTADRFARDRGGRFARKGATPNAKWAASIPSAGSPRREGGYLPSPAVFRYPASEDGIEVPEVRTGIPTEAGTIRRVGAGAPRPPNSPTRPARSQGTADKGRWWKRALHNAPADREPTTLLLAARPQDRDRLAAELAYTYPATAVAEAQAVAASAGPREAPGEPDGACRYPRVLPPASGSGSARERGSTAPRRLLSPCVVAVAEGTGKGAFASPGVVSKAVKAGALSAPRPAFVHDVPPSTIRFADGPETDAVGAAP